MTTDHYRVDFQIAVNHRWQYLEELTRYADDAEEALRLALADLTYAIDRKRLRRRALPVLAAGRPFEVTRTSRALVTIVPVDRTAIPEARPVADREPDRSPSPTRHACADAVIYTDVREAALVLLADPSAVMIWRSRDNEEFFVQPVLTDADFRPDTIAWAPLITRQELIGRALAHPTLRALPTGG